MALGACVHASGAAPQPSSGAASGRADGRARSPGGADTEAAAPEPTLFEGTPAPVRAYGTRHHDLAHALARAGASCDAVARALDAWTAAHGDEFRRAVVALDAWELRASRREVREHHERMAPDVGVRAEVGRRCDRDPGARAAFDRFFAAVGFDR